jgi:predicted RNA-binding Zn-ribbon protein involved in translation (DUF1610 family)
MRLNLNQDYMDHMMDWGPNGWFILISGGVLFLLFVIIVLYFLFRNQHSEDLKNSLDHITNGNNNYSEIQTQNYNKSVLSKIKEENLKQIAFFCPNCGERLEKRTFKICPLCGSKI